MKQLLPFLICAFIFACKKEHSHEATAADKATELEVRAWASGKAFRLESYTASQPIVYQEGDSAVTNLYGYIPWEILDDSTILNASGSMDVYQEARVYSFFPDAKFSRPWAVKSDDRGVFFDYLTYRYEPLEFHFSGHTDSTLTLSVPWPGDKAVNLITVLKVLK